MLPIEILIKNAVKQVTRCNFLVSEIPSGIKVSLKNIVGDILLHLLTTACSLHVLLFSHHVQTLFVCC